MPMVEQVNQGPHRIHPTEERLPVYLTRVVLDPHKLKYIEVSEGLEALLRNVRQESGEPAEIIIPGVGGVREPEILFNIFKQQMVALDHSPQVVQAHERRNIRLGLTHEKLMLGDARKMDLPDGCAKLVSFSSVMHEIVSEGIIEGIRRYKPVGKDEIVRAQLNELKRLIAPGGILALQDILPQPAGTGRLRLNTDIAKNFFKRFLACHAAYFGKQTAYKIRENEEGTEIEGTLSDLSEIWWHFRWWWVLLRRTAPRGIVEPSLKRILGRDPLQKEETDFRLSRQVQTEDWNVFVSHLAAFDSDLETVAGNRLRSPKASSKFREWKESYNIADGPDSLKEYLTAFCNNDWFATAYEFADSRDNQLLNKHFSLSDSQGIPLSIEPKRLLVYARRKSQDGDDQGIESQILAIADDIIGRENRILPESDTFRI